MSNCNDTKCYCINEDICSNNKLKCDKSNYYVEVKPECDFDGDCGNCYGCLKGSVTYPIKGPIYNNIRDRIYIDN